MSEARRSQMVRVIEWFESSDLREARACFALVRETMEARMKSVPEPTPFHKKRRARKPKASDPASMSMAEQESAASEASA